MAEIDDPTAQNCDWSIRCSPPGANRIDLEASWIRSPNLSTIDAMVRLHLVARHRGQSVWLHGATCELVELVELVGFGGSSICARVGRQWGLALADLFSKAWLEAEDREQAGVEECVNGLDAPAGDLEHLDRERLEFAGRTARAIDRQRRRAVSCDRNHIVMAAFAMASRKCRMSS